MLRLAALGLAAIHCAAPAGAARGAQILGYELGARPAALSGAYTAAGNDALSLHWNPAGLADLPASEASLSQSRWLEGFRLLDAAYGRPIGRTGAAAFALTHVDYGDFEKLDQTGAPAGSFGASDLALAAGAAFSPAEDVGLGAAIKGFRQTLENESAMGAALDVGGLLRRGNVRLGAAVQNLGPQVKFRQEGEALPTTIRLGAAYKPRRSLLVALEGVEQPGGERSFRVGGEYRTPAYRGVRAALRVGYRVAKGLLGASYGFAVESDRWRLAAAVVPMGEFQIAQWVSLTWRFGRRGERRERPKPSWDETSVVEDPADFIPAYAPEQPKPPIPAYAPPEKTEPIPAYAPKSAREPIPAFAPQPEQAPVPAYAPQPQKEPIPAYAPKPEGEAIPAAIPEASAESGARRIPAARMYADALDWYRGREATLAPAQRRAVLRRLMDEYRAAGLDVSALESAYQEVPDEAR